MDKTNENKKLLCHSMFGWTIAVLLCLILFVLVFKAGVMVGSSKSHFSPYGTGKYYMYKGDGLMEQKKAKIEVLEAKAESMGMTVEEYKKYLIEQKKVKLEAETENGE